jgi:hypothetical protein
MAYDVSQDYSQDFCGTEHIIYSILSQNALSNHNAQGYEYQCGPADK